MHGSPNAVPSGFLADPKQELGQDQVVARPMSQQPDPSVNISPSDAQGAPSSDNEIFVDAITAPLREDLSDSSRGIVLANLDQQVECTFRDRSFEMSDGEERSMARLVIELDSRKCDPLPSYDAQSPEKANKDRSTMECITVHTDSERENSLSKSQSGELLPVDAQAHTGIDDSHSAGRKPRKRKRMTEKRQNTSGKRRRRITPMNEDDADTILDSQVPPVHLEQLAPVSDTEVVEAGGIINDGKLGDGASLAFQQGSPDLSYNPSEPSSVEPLELDDDAMDSDTAAVNLQLITEASQQSEADNHAHFISDDATQSPFSSEVEVMDHDNGEMPKVNTRELKFQGAIENNIMPPVEQSAVEKIAASLRDSLEGLRTATLSREDVYKIESMFMDIKKELYEAERRSR
ncbi:hypothetical protein ONZ43_g3588 [Nemania bipapillata]|uniref:Uncharacterized protein n=1 Tax=Nemania bipapillata TaxID=110536 RepID=A0ACC2IWI0_9PEZI|nr:hypothetical protein ONZ43_g3588 [Nemania bipapillata]